VISLLGPGLSASEADNFKITVPVGTASEVATVYESFENFGEQSLTSSTSNKTIVSAKPPDTLSVALTVS